MKLEVFFLFIDIMIVLGSTGILFYFSKKTNNQLLHFFKTLAYVLVIMIAGYFMTIYAMFGGIIPRNSLVLSIILILITNILLYGIYILRVKQKGKKIYPLVANIIYMSLVIYTVYYFGHI